MSREESSMSFSPSNSIAPYLQTSTYFPEDFESFRIKFLEVYRNISYATNSRGIAVFDLQEFLTGEQWFSDDPQTKRQTFRKVFSLGAINAGATSTVAHNILGITSFTYLGGTCVTAVPDFRPIPFSSASNVNQQIEIRANSTNLIVVNGSGAPNITSAIVTLEFLKS